MSDTISNKKPMISTVRKIIILIFMICVAYWLGRESAPSKVEIKEVEVIKYIENTSLKEKTQKDESREVISEKIEKPDGTKVTTVKTIYLNRDKTETYEQTKQVLEREALTEKVVMRERSPHVVSLIALSPKNFTPWENPKNMGVVYQNNLFLNLTVGAGATIGGEYFMLLGLKF